MPSVTGVAKMVLLISGLSVVGYAEGPAAFYDRVNLGDVCVRRNENGWGPSLDCDWPCLAAWGRYRPEMLGRFVLADLPGCSWRVCEIVDVRGKADEAANGHIIIEIDGETARACGWQTYQEGVKVWRLGNGGGY